MMPRGFFITGTDTGIGKTWIAAGLIRALQRTGYRVAAMKPVACGFIDAADGPVNEDVVLLQRQADATGLPRSLINRYAFAPPISPHLAAGFDGQPIEIDAIVEDLQQIAGHADMVVLEGAGGWEVPINAHQTMADLAIACGLPVVLVTGIRLGCLNHSLLTSRAIAASGLEFAGWIANLIEPETPYIEENIETLRKRIPAPMVGKVPWMDGFDVERIADELDVEELFYKVRN